MAATNKKIDAIRRLILGPLYGDCQENPLGVEREVRAAGRGEMANRRGGDHSSRGR